MLPERQLFICDTHVNRDPSAEQIAEIALLAAEEVRRFGITPSVALLSHSSFGSSDAPSAHEDARRARAVRARAPELAVEGEMRGDAALSKPILDQEFPDSGLAGEANVLVMPNVDAANISLQPAAHRRRRRHHRRRHPARRGAAGAHPHAVGDGAAHRQHDGAGGGRRGSSAPSAPSSAIVDAPARWLQAAARRRQDARIPIRPARRTRLAQARLVARAAAGRARCFREVKRVLREQALHTVCEEARCPNIGECFSRGTATFMVLGRPVHATLPVLRRGARPPAAARSRTSRAHLADTVARLRPRVRGHHQRRPRRPARRRRRRTSRPASVPCASGRPRTRIEVLTPDFRGRLEAALDCLAAEPPDVMNHNLETVPRLYREARPGADYAHSLRLLSEFKRAPPRRADQVRADARPRRNRRRGARRDARPARATASTC